MEGLIENLHRDIQAACRPCGITEQADGYHADLSMRQLAGGRCCRDAAGRFGRVSTDLARNATGETQARSLRFRLYTKLTVLRPSLGAIVR